jgi:hypothetical protein
MSITRNILYELSTGLALYDKITGGLLYDNTDTYEITRDDYFDRTQPAKSEELINSVSVPITALIAGAVEEVYRSEAGIIIAAGENLTINAEYSNTPVSGAGALFDGTHTDITITSAAYYAWGAIITLHNAGAVANTFELYIEGTVYTVNSDEVAINEDAASQLENGILKYDYPVNHLVQSRAVGDLIGAGLLLSFKTPRKDVSLNWRGDPSLVLGDVFEAPEYQKNDIDVRGGDVFEAPEYQKNDIDVRGLFYIYKQKLDFDGTLKAVTDGRKTV